MADVDDDGNTNDDAWMAMLYIYEYLLARHENTLYLELGTPGRSSGQASGTMVVTKKT